MPYRELFFCLLPPAVAFACARERFFSSELLEQALGKARGNVSRRQLLAVLALVPVSLAAYASGGEAVRVAGSVASSLGAVWGGSRIAGRAGAAAAATVVVLAWTSGAELVFDVCALLAAVGVGHLLAAILNRRTLPFFLGTFAAVDTMVVTVGMTRQAMFPAAFGDLFPLAGRPPVFVGMIVGTFFLGTVDIACGVLIASLISGASARTKAFVLAVYLACQTALVAGSAAFSVVVPATLPPLVALVAYRFAVRRQREPQPARS